MGKENSRASFKFQDVCLSNLDDFKMIVEGGKKKLCFWSYEIC